MARKQQPDEVEDAAETNVDILRGGPGQEVPEPEETAPSAPQLREMTIKGRKFQVDPDLAEVLSERDRDIDRKLSEHSAELGNLRKFYQEHQPAPRPEEKPKYATLLFENPDEAVNRIKEEIRQEYMTEKQKEEERRLQAEQSAKFWDAFYKKNKDLDPDDDGPLVRAVLSDHMNDLYHLPTQDGIEKLADLTRNQILRIQQKAQLSDDDKPAVSRTRVEPSSRPTQRVASREPETPATLTELIKQRRAARNKSAA